MISTSKTWADERVKTVSRWANSVFPLGTQNVLRQRDDGLVAAEIASNATRRQREFAAGRACASALLSRWDVSEPVGVAQDRSPIWPDGFAGSISHSNHWIWSAVSKSSQTPSIGIDTEAIVSPDTSDILQEDIVSNRELAVVRSLGLSEAASFTLAFSAKEAFYKCWYPITQAFFDFKQAAITSCTPDTIQIASLDNNPNYKIAPHFLNVHYFATDRDVFTATWMEQQA